MAGLKHQLGPHGRRFGKRQPDVPSAAEQDLALELDTAGEADRNRLLIDLPLGQWTKLEPPPLAVLLPRDAHLGTVGQVEGEDCRVFGDDMHAPLLGDDGGRTDDPGSQEHGQSRWPLAKRFTSHGNSLAACWCLCFATVCCLPTVAFAPTEGFQNQRGR